MCLNVFVRKYKQVQKIFQVKSSYKKVMLLFKEYHKEIKLKDEPVDRPLMMTRASFYTHISFVI